MWNKFVICALFILLITMACEKKEKMEKILLEIKGIVFTIEVARTMEEQQRGLMFREKMGAREGMLFAYKEYTKGGFWMKNTKIPLSIAFISDTGKILDIKHMMPYSLQSIYPDYSYMYALEVNKGTFQEIGAVEGDFIKFPAGFR